MNAFLKSLALGLVVCVEAEYAEANLGGPEKAMVSVVEVFAGNYGSTHCSQGSGVVIKPNRIVTNYHVVQGRTQIRINLYGNSPKKDIMAHVYQIDSVRDLALLACSESLQPISIAPEESFHVDDFVHAIGYPGGSRRVTSGKIIGIQRKAGFRIVQTSAEINQGNSGGALIDEKGQLIGINFRTSITYGENQRWYEAIHLGEVLNFAERGSSMGSSRLVKNESFQPFGFLPSTRSNPFANRSYPNPLPSSQRAQPTEDELPGAASESDTKPSFYPEAPLYAGPSLGARFEKCPNVFRTLGNQGMKIVRLDPGGAADSYGMRIGDEILTMDDKLIGSLENFVSLIKEKEPGTRVVFQILRKGLFQEVAVILEGESYPAPKSMAKGEAQILRKTRCDDPRRLGVSVASYLNPQKTTSPQDGLQITAVTPGGPANYAGIQVGDVIVAINGQKPGLPYDFVLFLHSLRPGIPVELKVLRKQETQTVSAVIRGG